MRNFRCGPNEPITRRRVVPIALRSPQPRVRAPTYLGNLRLQPPISSPPSSPPLTLPLFHRQSCPPKPASHPLAVLLHLPCQNRPSGITQLVGYVPCKKSTRQRVECLMM